MKKILRVRKNFDGDVTSLQVPYYNYVIRNFFGLEYAVDMNVIKVDREFLICLNEELDRANRPSHRSHLNISFDNTSVIIMNDLRGEHEFLVELKPKWGFDCSNKSCKFCRLQHTKPYPIGDFCPTELFSNNPKLVRSALLKLFRNPRNQLKISSRNDFVDPESSLRLVDILTDILSKDSILQKIHESHFVLMKDVHHYEDISITDYFELIKQHLRLNSLESPILRLFVSISIEDCSLMISFDSLDLWSIKILDLDIKLPHKQQSYIEEHDILRARSIGEKGEVNFDK